MTTVALVSLLAVVSPLRAQKRAAPSAQELLDAAADYARGAYPKLANIVATEEYDESRRSLVFEDREGKLPADWFHLVT